jgi:hypothetical protein
VLWRAFHEVLHWTKVPARPASWNFAQAESARKQATIIQVRFGLAQDRSYLYPVVSCAKAYIWHLKSAAQSFG